MNLVANEARRQGFTVFNSKDTDVWTFKHKGKRLSVPTPKKPLHYMELRDALTRMGMIWPF